MAAIDNLKQMQSCKIPYYQTLYAHPMGYNRFIIREHGELAIHDITIPVTRNEARKLDFRIPRTCTYKKRRK